MRWISQKLALAMLISGPWAGTLQALPSSAEVKKRLLKTGSGTVRNLHVTILGDSISAGALAGTRLGTPPSPELISGIVGAIMTRDLQLFLTATLSPRAAYPDGDGAWSLRQKLMEHYRLSTSTLTLHNESAVGRAMSNVTEKLLKSLAPPKDDQAEQHILLMLGSNDFCQGKSPDGFKEASGDAFNLLSRTFPKAKVLVAEVPPIYQLKNFSQEAVFAQLNCEAVQRLYCDRLHAPDAESVVRSYNESLKKLVSETNKKQGSDRYKFISLPSDLTIDKDLLSSDCFHPGVEGHKKLAASLASQWPAR